MTTRVFCDICKKEAGEETVQTWCMLDLSSVRITTKGTIPPLRTLGSDGWVCRISIDLCERCEREAREIITEWMDDRRKWGKVVRHVAGTYGINTGRGTHEIYDELAPQVAEEVGLRLSAGKE